MLAAASSPSHINYPIARILLGETTRGDSSPAVVAGGHALHIVRSRTDTRR